MQTVEFPGFLFAVFSSDRHLCPDFAAGKRTWDEFLCYWYSERDSYPAVKAQTSLLLEQMVQIHHPAQVSMLTVALDPGAKGVPPHRHPGPVFGYVVEGEVLFEMRGHAPTIYKQDDVFYEPDGCLHLLANNPSPSRRALFVAVLIGEPGQPILTPVQLQADTNDLLESYHDSCLDYRL